MGETCLRQSLVSPVSPGGAGRRQAVAGVCHAAAAAAAAAAAVVETGSVMATAPHVQQLHLPAAARPDGPGKTGTGKSALYRRETKDGNQDFDVLMSKTPITVNCLT